MLASFSCEFALGFSWSAIVCCVVACRDRNCRGALMLTAGVDNGFGGLLVLGGFGIVPGGKEI